MLEVKDAVASQTYRSGNEEMSSKATAGEQQPGIQQAEEKSGFIEDEDKNFAWRDIGILEWFCIFAFWVLAFVVFYQFFTRYFLNDSAVWTEEIARNILIILTFFGSALALKRQAHISVQFFVSKLAVSHQKKMVWISSILQSVFFAFAVYLCLTVAEAMKFQKLMAIDLSRSVIYRAVALSFVAMLIIELYQSLKRLKSNEDRSPGGQS
ncbi:tripartite ATP-independent periplasmic transporter DctQ [Vibrio nigripulchritudo ATCC 27043]|uniref:TRAP transporter small permease n=1 Tax=Vibrio nigripulchritudo TaxID=28173 RepID=UPI00021C3EA3|nr:TRAP transporter small permease [Vibrio nigripulchritudo]EGU57956.1 tripartite ATP-independent periplasmic transporter DctQ [Vibrio nigripulchritudo ATCC 27043]